MKKSTLSYLIRKSQHYVNIISKSRLFVDIFAMSSMASLLVCNFLVHDKCLKLTTNPCVSVAATIVKVGKMRIVGSMSINQWLFARILLPIAGQMRKQSKENFAMCVGKKCTKFLASDVRVSYIDIIAVISALKHLFIFLWKMFIFMKLFDDLCSLLKC